MSHCSWPGVFFLYHTFLYQSFLLALLLDCVQRPLIFCHYHAWSMPCSQLACSLPQAGLHPVHLAAPMIPTSPGHHQCKQFLKQAMVPLSTLKMSLDVPALQCNFCSTGPTRNRWNILVILVPKARACLQSLQGPLVPSILLRASVPLAKPSADVSLAETPPVLTPLH